jgi:hypothetical protein
MRKEIRIIRKLKNIKGNTHEGKTANGGRGGTGNDAKEIHFVN